MEMPRFLRKIGFHLFAKRFVAGETIEDAVRVAKELEKKKIYAIINILGEHVKEVGEVAFIVGEYLELLKRLKEEGLDVHISIKPSQLGLDISRELYRECLGIILKNAQLVLPRVLVEIDREDHHYAKVVREVSLDLARTFPNQRLCCQLNLNETPEEIRQLVKAGISIRLCKGTAYPGDVEDEEKLRERFLVEAPFLSKKGKRPVAATHDLYLIDKLKGKGNLGFQVLRGIENKEMEKLIQENENIEVGFYVPCGSYWYSYGKRRWKSIAKIFWRNSCYRIKREKGVER